MTNHKLTIDELIEKQNPFAGNDVVRKQQIWRKSFPDAISINAHASNAVLDAVAKICQGQKEITSITITSEKGLGKSHIISRIRHQLQIEDKTLFIYMNKYDNLNQIKYDFLQAVASSLRAFGNKKVMQWQEIATALINEVKQVSYTPEQYINQYPSLLDKYSSKFIEQLSENIQIRKPEITNPYIVKAILWTLSPAHVNLANHWLSGLQLSEAEAKTMGLPNHQKQDQETESLRNARQILDIISYYKIPVICFDELDDPNVAENGLTTAQVIAGLVKDLYNNLKSAVFLLAMYPETWRDQIETLPQAEAVIDRLVSENSRKPIELKYLSPDDIITIVQQWLKEFYQKYEQIPPHPLYPFNENQLRSFGKAKPTIRGLLKWCADNFSQPKVVVEPEKNNHVNEVLLFYDKELKKLTTSTEKLLGDELKISKALKFSFQTLIGETIEGMTIDAVEEIEPVADNNGFLDFKIIANNKKIKIGVDVVQQSGSTLNAALDRLINYKTFKLTRGCLVRSDKISPGAKVARDKLKTLHDQKHGGKWVALQKQDILPILAISRIYDDPPSVTISKKDVLNFIKDGKIVINNPLIREILRPSTYDPMIDGDYRMVIPQSIINAE